MLVKSKKEVLMQLLGLIKNWNKKNRLTETARTARSWVQYMEYVKVIKMFIFAERIGDWESHLNATRRMLSLFATTGHYNYVNAVEYICSRC